MSRPHSLWSNFLNLLFACTVFAFDWLCMFIKNFLLWLNLFLVYLTRITTIMINWTWQDTFDLMTIILLTEYCCIACAAGGIVWLKFWRRSRDPKKGVGMRRSWFSCRRYISRLRRSCLKSDKLYSIQRLDSTMFRPILEQISANVLSSCFARP